MEEKSKLENPEKQAKPEVKDETLNEITGGESGVEGGTKVANNALNTKHRCIERL